MLDTVFLSQELASGKPDSEKIKMLTEKINALLEQVRQHVYIFEDSGTLGLLAVVTFFNNSKFKESYIFVSGCIGVCSHFFNNTKCKECYIFISGCIGVCFTPVIPKEIVYLGYLTLLSDFSLLLMIKMVNASTRVSLF